MNSENKEAVNRMLGEAKANKAFLKEFGTILEFGPVVAVHDHIAKIQQSFPILQPFLQPYRNSYQLPSFANTSMASLQTMEISNQMEANRIQASQELTQFNEIYKQYRPQLEEIEQIQRLIASLDLPGISQGDSYLDEVFEQYKKREGKLDRKGLQTKVISDLLFLIRKSNARESSKNKRKKLLNLDERSQRQY